MLRGSIVALVTPMTIDGNIDWVAMDGLLEWHIEMGTTGIVPVGTTGESATVSIDEHCKIVQHVVNTVRKRVPVIAGTGANATWEAIELTKAAKEAGADACLLVTPYYNKPTQEGLYQHYKAIADTVDLPQVLYNVPSRTACDMLPETIARLAELDQVIAVKEATGNIDRTKQILQICDLAVFSGDDLTACELMLSGAKGTISVTANVAPEKMAAMCNAAISGQAEDATSIDKSLAQLHNNLFLEANPIPVKWALAEMDRIPRGIRLPLTQLSPECHDRVLDAMRIAGITK
ncbi:MAG: 4-hydroxy-tetrahydrodipicolinate synthase [Candidatus Azotimanducaceae bacterium]|uniref:4-hydroxy-tetrahydrodipicolinate synthase n=1 Tax=OM182 bacterium TaxID=2510334 RepID=A0A520S2G5_9GAMM|nr:4-hydroxy-tetrahydrodipicolinate synthase [Gammaproteobacteria bacterium]OUV68260.1 MAG: 4-hydroxy-tetrahydrodipicolinate synthase [Gammaproteobacteria bacterium TMED133]RZO76667.1 MAG: 4-hydroxy-tetrahydrodipicolinate synthase [OM182 bacterium]